MAGAISYSFRAFRTLSIHCTPASRILSSLAKVTPVSLRQSSIFCWKMYGLATLNLYQYKASRRPLSKFSPECMTVLDLFLCHSHFPNLQAPFFALSGCHLKVKGS